MVILFLYVDDILLTASSESVLHNVTESLKFEFFMTDLGPIHYFLGVTVTSNSNGYFFHQSKYTLDLLTKSDLLKAKPASTPLASKSYALSSTDPVYSKPTFYRSLVGALQYLTFSHPNIDFVVHQVCQHMRDPHESHFIANKRILRYLKDMMHFDLQLYKSNYDQILAYSDAD